jgi:tetratricopeptide (TPR) repeat protein
MTKLMILAALLGPMLLALAVGHGPAGDDTQTAHRTNAAIDKFWEIYHGNRYGDIPEAQAQLEEALQFAPNNATLYALLGATHFWHVGEAARDPKPNPNVLLQDMPTAVRLFQKAVDLDYYGNHQIGYVNDDHLPGYLGITTVHAGQQSNDPSLIAKGDQLLDFAVYQFPEFNNFNRWAAHNTDSKDSDTYKKALESLWQALDNCAGGSIDRVNPDLGPYLHLQTSVGRKKACWSEGNLAPHSMEGFMLNLGNGLVKAGQIETAKVIYANAKYATNYADWPYRAELEVVAASDLYARAALYADNSSLNDPPVGVPNRGCSYCHAMVPEPAAGRPPVH